ncbi:MAG: hypothetical protein AAF361_15180, partial [Bacteroidota bacterium]
MLIASEALVMEIKEIIESAFGFYATSVSQLEGYDSTNFKIVCPEGKFVLKQYLESDQNWGLLKAENEILDTLSSLAYDFPKPQKTK